MRRLFTVLTAVFAVVSFSSMVSAQAATPAQTEKPKVAVEKVAPKTEKAPVKAEAVKVATPVALTASGKVAKLDEATKALTVTTKTGDKDFTMAADAKITVGAKAAVAGDLAVGKNVKVTYTTVDGKNVASKVTVATEAKAEVKAEKKEAKKAEKK